MTRVLLADDHPLIRSGLRTLLERSGEFKVIAEAANGAEAVELALAFKPDVVLLDVQMPRLNGPDAAKHLCEKMPGTRVLMLSMHADEAYVLRAIKAGVKGYLLKASPEADVLAAVRAVAAGHSYFSPEITRVLSEEYVAELRRKGLEDSYDALTLREKEVMTLLVAGNSNKDIADRLFVSPATVETHRTNIFQKVSVHNLPELILYAVRKGLI